MSKSSPAPSDSHTGQLASLAIFSPSSPDVNWDVPAAIDALERTLDAKSVGPIVQYALRCGRPYALEFIVSATSRQSAYFIQKHILEEFPPNANNYGASLACAALSRISSSLYDLPYPGEKPDGLENHFRHVDKAHAAFPELLKLVNGDGFDKKGLKPGSNLRDRDKHPRGRKHSYSATEAGPSANVATRLFSDLSLKVPRNHDSANEMVQSILDTQKGNLKFFCTLARRPDVAELIRDAYLRGVSHHSSVVDARLRRVGWQFGSVMGITSGHSTPKDRHFNVDLFIDSAADFGQWRIYCSGECLAALARDKQQAEAARNRLRDLSSGYFSETNQKRLTRESPVEVFRAWLPGVWRLVYHVDVIRESGRDFQTQVLRVLGVFTLTELKRQSWDKVGKYLALKGEAYTTMCKARRSRADLGPGYFEPVTFPVSSTNIPSSIAEDDYHGFGIENGDVDEIHRLMDLERYSVLSESVIQDILEGKKRNHVFQLSPEEEEVAMHVGSSSFVLGRSGTGKTTIIVLKMFGIEKAWQNSGCIGPRPRQMFVTKSQRLADKVEGDYMDFLCSLYPGSDVPDDVDARISRWNQRETSRMPDMDDLSSGRGDLPAKYSELREEHFPLFATTHTLYTLLEADITDSFDSDWSSRMRHKKWFSDLKEDITFDVFRREFWPQLPNTKGLAPSVAFSDFIGIIKGSEQSLEFPDHAIDRATYESRRDRRTDYSVFEAYQKLKRKFGGRDRADRVHDILAKLSDGGLKGETVDFVYVDEVQDLLLIDARLLIFLCQNPNGFLWAGDTAQTISLGSTFTFTQLAAAVWRYQNEQHQGTPRPKHFQLLVNYRSHGGIVRCANAIVDILQRFPKAIDELRPESSIVGKQLPVFFTSETSSPAIRDLLSLRPGGQLVKLGSEQCIIVRDDITRRNVRTAIGKRGTILSIFGSKGLEFDDVILYNFFEDTVQDDLWRDLLTPNSANLAELKYAPLIHELKLLYVAMTRARHRLWVVDYSGRCFWLQRFLLEKGLIKVNSTENAAEFATESTAEEWVARGHRLMAANEFEEAGFAFETAGDAYMAAVAEAYRLREVARDVSSAGTSAKRRRDTFVEVALAFEKCATMTRQPTEKKAHHATAARCYAEIKKHHEVVRTLKLASTFTEAASYCFENGMLDQSVRITKDYAAQIDPTTKERITKVARLSYFEEKRLQDAAELFDDKEEKMEFLLEHDLGEARALVLEEDREYGKAIQGYLEEGLLSAALDLFRDHILEMSQDSNILRSIFHAILWRHFSFGSRSWNDSVDISRDQVLRVLSAIPASDLKNEERNTVKLFKLMLTSAKTDSFREFVAHSVGLDKALQLMALDFLFDDMPSAIDTSSQSSIILSLQLLHQYTVLIREAASPNASWEPGSWLPVLFQFWQDGKGTSVRPGSFLWARSAAGCLSREDLAHTLRSDLYNRLRPRVYGANSIASRVSLFSPCMQMVHSGRCDRSHTYTVAHELDGIWFNRRIRFHLLRIMLFDNLFFLGIRDHFPSRVKAQTDIIHAFEGALNPLLHLTGSESSLNEEQIPEARVGLLTLRRWALDVLYSLDPFREELQLAFLTNLCKAFAVGMIRRGDQNGIDGYLRRLPCARYQRHPMLVISRSPGAPIYALDDLIAFLDGTGSITRAVTFLRHLIFERFPIDLAVLCSLVERTFGLTVLTAVRRGTGSLHGVLLPKSWVVALWEDFNKFKDQENPPVMALVQVTEQLFVDVYTGKAVDSTLPRNRSKDVPFHHVRDVVLARICRCFCLLGANLNRDRVLRDRIEQVMASSKTSARHPRPSYLHGSYIRARDWSGLMRCLYRSTTSPFDQLVQLYSATALAPAPPSAPGVRRVVFQNADAIPEAIESRYIERTGHGAGRVGSLNRAPRATLASGLAAQDIFEGDTLQSGGGFGGDAQGNTPDHSADDVRNVSVIPDDHDAVKNHMAAIIQRAYRHMRKRLEEAIPQDPSAKARYRHVRACRTTAQAIHARYRKLYLGPLPHLLFSLEWAALRAQELKKRIKAGRANASLQKLSDLMNKQTLVNGIIKEGTSLLEQLKPGSPTSIHSRAGQETYDARWLADLRNAVVRARRLLKNLSDPNAPMDDFKLAFDGIMPEKLRVARR